MAALGNRSAPGSLLDKRQGRSRRARPSAPGQRQPRQHDPRHLTAIRACPCVLCKAEAEAAHVRYGDPQRGKRPTGIGERPSDRWTVPLCPDHHRAADDSQHDHNERSWWLEHGLDPLAIAEMLLRGLAGRRGDDPDCEGNLMPLPPGHLMLPKKGPPLIRRLFEEANAQKVRFSDVCKRSGMASAGIKQWRYRGAAARIGNVEAVGNALGLELCWREREGP